MRRLLLSLLMFLAPIAGLANFSQVIIFGDSYSDIGNVPESHSVIDPALNAPAQNLYIPTSNPINTSQQQSYQVAGTDYQDAYPTRDQGLPPKAPLGNQIRQYRSASWSQYFVQMAYQAHLLDSDKIIPSTQLAPKNPAQLSVNYAWYSALSHSGCANVLYDDASPTCRQSEVIKHAEMYRKHQPEVSILSLRIPGLLQQVAFFLADESEHKIQTNPDTLYILFIGGNDIAQAFAKFTSGNPFQMTQAVNTYLFESQKNLTAAIERLIRHGAQHIALVSYPDLSELPKVHNMAKAPWARITLKWIAHQLSNYYNLQQRHLVMDPLKQQYPQVHFYWLPIANAITRLNQNPAYRMNTEQGKPCMDSNALYRTAAADPQNCEAQKNQNGFVYWNNAHFTGVGYQVMAWAMVKALSISPSHTPASSS